MKKLLLLVIIIGVVVVLLRRSGPTEGPVINFVGVATGTLLSDVNALHFKDMFEVTEHDIVGVVSFEKLQNNTQVEATWFSPDDRRMPLGRKTIMTESGAKIAKFSISNGVDWESAPYMLDIRAMQGEGDNMITASGSVHFFIGMDEQEIGNYWDDWSAYQANEAQQQVQREEEAKRENNILISAAKSLRIAEAKLASKIDVDADGIGELVIIDPPASEEAPMMGFQDVSINQMLVLNSSGATMFSVLQSGKEKLVSGASGPIGTALAAKKTVNLTIDPTTGTVHLKWEDDDAQCAVTYTFENGAYKESERLCTGIDF